MKKSDRTEESSADRQGIRVLERFFGILSYLAGQNDYAGIKEIAEATGLSRTTVHRILATCEENYVVLKDGIGRYRIGPKSLVWANSYQQQTGLAKFARQHLKGLLRDVAQYAAPALAAPEPPVRLDGVRLLLAEDNAINQQIASEILSGVGAVVDIAANGQEAVDAVLRSAKSGSTGSTSSDGAADFCFPGFDFTARGKAAPLVGGDRCHIGKTSGGRKLPPRL